ncbi:hypothetical protein ABNX05_11230 [Lysinibacillus sp. M3]|uniref:Uncharacterized protein n=1 Tax=Lysinibacillus zambalensis TaxID=3160866 RepID=A0ABV1MRP6_9BACI
MDMNFQANCIAAENLRNNSICIKDDNMIRNIKHYTELETELFVFVTNTFPLDNDKITINKGEMVRYFKVKL